MKNIEKNEEISMGIILGNRGFFADELCKKARAELLPQLENMGIKPVILPEEENVYGSIETRSDARKCAQLFNQHKDEIKGIIVSLPNFGDEKAAAQTLRMTEVDVPVLVHAFPDDVGKMDYENRRDSFCGKISVCNNLRQYGIDYTLTEMHNEDPASESFKKDIEKFKGICRVVDVLNGARVGIIGPRPADFNTVRYSEKLLEYNNISVEPIGVIDIVEEIDTDREEVQNEVEKLKNYMDTSEVDEEPLRKMAGFSLAVNNWIEQNDLDTAAIQCWDALQKHLGINPCAVMSYLSNSNLPAACESDVMGALSMLALQAASTEPSALADWNNNFGDNPEQAVLFHCGNFASDMYTECKMKYAEILGSTLGEENTQGAVYGMLQPGDITFARLSTDDTQGKIKAYVAEGEIFEEDLKINGSWGAVRVPELQDLLQYICNNGFEHHVGINLSAVSDILAEAFANYMGWEVYNHNN